MILTQTTALFVDAYRELNARKLFWVTIALNLVVIAIYASRGSTRTGSPSGTGSSWTTRSSTRRM